MMWKNMLDWIIFLTLQVQNCEESKKEEYPRGVMLHMKIEKQN